MKLHSREFACALRALVCAATCAAAITIVLHGQHCLAIDSQWNSDADGLFTDPARWDNGVPNGLATFRRGDVSYAVQFDTDTTIDRLRVGTNAVTFLPSGDARTLRIRSASFSEQFMGAIIGELPGDDASLTSHLPEITVLEMTLGLAANSAGKFTVSNGSFTASRSLVIGQSGSARFDALDSLVNSSWGVTIGQNAGSSGAATIDGQSEWNTGGITVGAAGEGTLRIRNGARVLSGTSVVGAIKSGLGSVIIDGVGSTWMTPFVSSSFSALTVGHEGTGTLEVTNGGRLVSGATYLGRQSQARGAVTIDGPGSTWESLSVLVGYPGGQGELTISNGGAVSSRSSAISQGSPASDGTVTVDGVGSTWTVSEHIYVLNNGELTISNGGRVSSRLARLSGSTGASRMPYVSVHGPGSSWSLDDNLSISGAEFFVYDGGRVSAKSISASRSTLGGNGTIVGDVRSRSTVAPGMSIGTLTIDGNFIHDPQPDQLASTLIAIEVASATEFDKLLITGSAAFVGTLQVSLLNGFLPQLGDEFDILDFASASGQFSTLQLPSLGDALAWDTSLLYTEGTLSIAAVPEPASLVLMLLGLASLARRSARRGRCG